MRIFAFLFACLLLAGCHRNFFYVYPGMETEPVESADDAADDLAIYIHPTLPARQAIVATNKQVGLIVYDNTGKAIHSYPFGKINNVDMRQDVPWNGQSIHIVGGSNRTNNSIVFYQLHEEDLSLSPLHEQPILSSVDEVYGFCMYYAENCYAFVVGKDGIVEQWLLQPDAAGKLTARVVRSFDAGSQSEGLVADDQLGYLYVGEEDVGVWKYQASAQADDSRTNVLDVKLNPHVKDDIEGVCLYLQEDGGGYLIVSSQGNNSYAVFERQGQNAYLGSFRIAPSPTIGGTRETDGIDVSAKPFGPFPAGVFVAQDGYNGRENQNFKLVDYRQIQAGIDSLRLINR